ncbi:MAG: SLC13 family permease [Christensenellales bacterium]|jgi:Na+/H+ antiporter NhaD/arsenite permease-like protein|nr:TRAP transporter large permease subunit [Clostridiales bacterium]
MAESTKFIIAIVLFAVTYILLLALPKYRAYVALVSAVLYLAIGILPIKKLLESVDWNVLMMIGGTMGIVALFIKSEMPSLLAEKIIHKTPNVQWAMVSLSFFAGLVSAFIDNVATVLMIAPIALTICKKLEISPVNCIIAIAISSNLQGAATLVGDTTSIMLGGYANMTFLDFFIYRGKMGLFFVVQISAILATLLLLFVFRKDKQKITLEDQTKVKDFFPSVLLLLMIVLLIIASFLPAKAKIMAGELDLTNGVICVSLLLIGLIKEAITEKNVKVTLETVKEIDFFTLLLLGSLFVVIAGIKEAGVIDRLSEFFVSLSGGNLFAIYSILVWFSVLLSAFIDNIPYVATMLPVVSGIAALMGVDPTLLYFGLISGATLGGNLTPIGASANITALGILRKDGHEVKALQFMKISVPFTLIAVVTGYVLIWLVWGM